MRLPAILHVGAGFPSLLLTKLDVFAACRTIGRVTIFFCYSYYSNSARHAAEFHDTKLGV